jgi:hypothetical protein
MNPNRPSKKQRELRDLIKLFLLVVFLPLVIGALGLWLVYRLSINLMVWLLWCSRGRFVLFVYSDSPNWNEHIRDHILPNIRDCSVVLNWSERKQWKKRSLPVLTFWCFGGGYREYNPLAVVFRPMRFTKVFRFWKPFKDLKRGRTEPIENMEREFFALVDSIAARKPA